MIFVWSNRRINDQEIERRCEEEFEESGIEKDQLLKLKDILRVDKREKISVRSLLFYFSKKII